MPIQRFNQFPEGSGSLTADDIFLFMDDPANSGITKKVSLNQLASILNTNISVSGGGGGGLTLEQVDDRVSELLVGNSGIVLNYNDENNSLTISFNAIGVGSGNCCNPFDQDLNTFNSPTFNNITISGSKINGGGTNSGDGNGYGTIELIPDSGLYTNDQYLIVDPTGPNHIHLRAGGTQDNSNAELIIGGELANLKITDYNHQAQIQSSNQTIITDTHTVNVVGSYNNILYSQGCLPVGSQFTHDDTVYTVVSCNEDPNNPGEFWNILDKSITINGSLDGFAATTESISYTNNNWTFQNDGNLSVPGNILLPNGTSVASGSYDNGTGGNNGISLNCAVGYELNWQGGHLKNTYDNGAYTADLLCDSPISLPGTGLAYMRIDSSGITFSDNTRQITAYTGCSCVGGSGGNSLYTTGVGLNSIQPIYGNNIASGNYSNVTGGKDAIASLYGEEAHAAGKFFSAGDAQVRKFILRTSTNAGIAPIDSINDITVYPLLLDGGENPSSLQRINIPNDSTWHYTIKVVARQDNTGYSAAYEFKGCLKVYELYGASLMPYMETILYEDIPDWHVYLRTFGNTLDIYASVPDYTAGIVYWVAYVEAVQVIAPPPPDEPPPPPSSSSSESSSSEGGSSSSSDSSSSSSDSSSSSSEGGSSSSSDSSSSSSD